MMIDKVPTKYCPACSGDGYLQTALGRCPVCEGECMIPDFSFGGMADAGAADELAELERGYEQDRYSRR